MRLKEIKLNEKYWSSISNHPVEITVIEFCGDLCKCRLNAKNDAQWFCAKEVFKTREEAADLMIKIKNIEIRDREKRIAEMEKRISVLKTVNEKEKKILKKIIAER